MSTRDLRPSLVLSAFTLLVWTTRINNIWADDELTTAGQVGRTLLALVFTVFAVVTIIAAVRTRRTRPAHLARWIRAFAMWTVGVWVVRGVQIAVADHGAAFIAVHMTLAVVSIGLAGWAVWAASLVDAADPTPGDQQSARQRSNGDLAR